MSEAQRLLSTQPQAAVAAARRSLERQPGDDRASLMLAAALRRTDGLPEAERLLRDLARRQPAVWGIWYEYGVTLALRGAGDPAMAALRRAVELNPASLLAQSALADRLALADDSADTERVLARAALMRRRADLEVLADDLDRAPPSSDRLAAAGLDANDPVSAGVVGSLALERGRVDAAAQWLMTAAARWPAYASLRRTLALAQLAQLRGPAALQTVRSLFHDQAPPPLQGLYAEALIQAREDAAAADVLEALVARRPELVRAWLALGHVRKTLGDPAGAARAYRAAIARSPDCGEAYASIANLKVESFTPDEAAALTAQLGRPTLDPDVRADLLFAQALALEDQDDVAGAFDRYSQANALRRRRRPHDAEAHTAFVERTCAAMSAELFRARRDQGSLDASPIFVVGLPRAGSTLVEQILACHSEVEGCDELPVLPMIAREALRRGGGDEADYPGGLGRLTPTDLKALGEAYLSEAAPYRKLGRPRFVDKFPGNFLHIGLIALILPRARVVDIRRDAEPCCLSLFRQNFAEGQAYSHDLTDLGRYYRDYVRLIDHMEQVLPRPPIRLRYETLVADPEPQIRSLLAALDLSFDPACLAPHASDRPVRTASAEQVRRPISSAGLDRWRAFEPWLGPLRRGLNGE